MQYGDKDFKKHFFFFFFLKGFESLQLQEVEKYCFRLVWNKHHIACIPLSSPLLLLEARPQLSNPFRYHISAKSTDTLYPAPSKYGCQI